MSDKLPIEYSQYQPNTGWITDLENAEELVEYCLCDDGDLLLSMRTTLKPIHQNELHANERFVLHISKKTFMKLYTEAIKNGVLEGGNK